MRAYALSVLQRNILTLLGGTFGIVLGVSIGWL
jgi:hypothetical protein